MKSIKISCISENTIFNHSLLASLGQSLLVEVDETKYLVDTTEIYEGLLYNMKYLDIQFDAIESVVLTHNHLDHSGGLFKLIDRFTEQKLYLPPDMMLINENNYNVSYRTHSKEEAVRRLLDYENTVVVKEGMRLGENVFLTGPLDADVKEQSMILVVPNKGMVLVIGCAHPTLSVIVERAKEITGIDKVYGIVGGLHYIFSSDKQVVDSAAYIASLNPEFIVPSHCTGYKAIREMQRVLGGKVHVSSTGQFGTGNYFSVLPVLDFHLR